MAPRYRLDDGWCFWFHGDSIVEQENWGNAVYALAAIILPWAPGLLPELFFHELSHPRIVVSIAVSIDDAAADYRLATISV